MAFLFLQYDISFHQNDVTRFWKVHEQLMLSFPAIFQFIYIGISYSFAISTVWLVEFNNF